jgi:hypothetical protein
VNPRTAGVALALAHLAIVGSVALRYAADRARLPLGWAQTVPYDPSLPIRGRYVRLRLQLPLAEATPDARAGESRPVRLRATGDRIEAVVDSSSSLLATLDSAEGTPVARLAQPVAFFIPEHVPDPSVRPAGEELWAEVTIPPTGPPRPVRLGVRRAGRLEPLDLR